MESRRRMSRWTARALRSRLRLTRLEARVTPAVTWSFDKVTGILTGVGDAANDVIVFTGNQDQFVEVNGAPLALGSPGQLIPVKEIRGLGIDGGGGDDQIDVSKEVWRQDFGQVRADRRSEVRIAGGTGNDTITGSKFADAILGGAGLDVINAGGGDDLIEGTWDDLVGDTIDGGTGVNGVAVSLPGSSSLLSVQVDTTSGGVGLGFSNQLAKLFNFDEVNVTSDQISALTVTGSTLGGASGVEWSAQSTTKGNESDFFSVMLHEVTHAFGVKYSHPGGGGGGDLPIESVSFNFSKMEVKYSITGSSGNDTFTIDPGPNSVTIDGGAGADSLFVNHGGLAVSSTASAVTVLGKAPVNFTGIESVSNGLHLTGDAARDALSDAKVSVTTSPGLTPDVTVFTVSNGGDRPVESISFNFSKIEYRVAPEPRGSSPGVSVTETFFSDNLALADLAAGAAPGRKDITFTLPPIAPGQSANFALTHSDKFKPQGINAARTVQFSLGASAGGPAFSGEYFEAVELAAPTFAPVTLASPGVGTPTLIGATADGVPLTLNASPGVDPYVTTFTPGTHLYFGGQMIDVAPDGKTSGNGSVSQASTSYDGRVVAFVTGSTNLTGDPDTNGFDDVIVALAGVHNSYFRCYTIHGTSAPAPNGPSRNPRVSGDGSAVYFESLASNLVQGVSDTNNDWDLLRFDVATGQLDYVNRGSPVFMANRGINHWGERADGRAAVFTTLATDVGSGVGLQIGFASALGTTYLSLPSYVEGVHQHRVAMSPDGRTVAFWTDANVSPLTGVPDNNGKLDLLTIDTATMQVTLQSRNAAGTATGNGATPAVLDGNFDFSFDGAIVTTTTSTNLAGATTATDTVALVSKDNLSGSIWNFHVWSDSFNGTRIDVGGHSIAFLSNADFRTPGAPNLPADQAWVYDLASQWFSLASTDANGAPASAPVTYLTVVKGSGSDLNIGEIMFVTPAPLVPGDTDALADVYTSVAHRTLSLQFGGPGTVALDTKSATPLYTVTDPTTGAVLASRPASITDWVFLTGSAGDDSLTIDLESGLTGLAGTVYDGGGGTGDKVTLSATSKSLNGAEIDFDDDGLRTVRLVRYKNGLNGAIAEKVGDVRFVGTSKPSVELKTQMEDILVSSFGAMPSSISIEDTGTAADGVIKVVKNDSNLTLWAPSLNRLSVTGSTGNDTITVGKLDGLTPAALALELFGGDGNDVIDGSASSVGLFISGGNGSDTVTGSPFADVIACVRRPDVIFGGLGDDTFIVSPDGGDTIDFGGGANTLDFSLMDRPVTLDADKTGVGQVFTASGEVLTLASPPAFVIGSAYGDVVRMTIGNEPRAFHDANTEDFLIIELLNASAVVRSSTDAMRIGQMGVIGRYPLHFHKLNAGVPAVGIGSNGIGAVQFVNAAPPAAPVAEINGLSSQRSVVATLAVPFNYAASFAGNPADAFSLKTTGGATVPFTLDLITAGGRSTAYLTPANLVNGSLSDGRYVLTILNSQFVGGLPGNADVVTEFHRLFGDADGDATVTTADFLAFRLAFLSESPTFDATGDGLVTALDFLQFRLRFLQSV